MKLCEADFTRITLMIQRMLDAEVLESEVGGALLADAEAGGRLLEAGDEVAARQHAERLAVQLVALVGSGDLDLLDGRAVIQTVGGMLPAYPTPSHTEGSKGEGRCQ